MSQKRDAKIEKMKARLDEWNADLDRWEAKVAQAKAEGRREYVERVETLRWKWQDLRRKLSEAQEAGAGAWEQLLEGFEDAWRNLKTAFEKARSELD